MIINKIIEIGIDIKNPINFFSNTYDNILRYLRETYENKCFRSCFITEIRRIIKYSEPIIDQEQDHCFAKLNVQFEVNSIAYTNGDIINGCEVINKDKTGSILCSSKYACIGLKAHKYLQSIKLNQLISIVVGDASYHPGSDKISVKGLPLLLDKEPDLYYIDTSKLTTDQKDIVNDFIYKIKIEEKKQEEVLESNKRAWDFFDDRLYSYKKEQEIPKDATEISIFLDNIDEKYLINGELIGWVSRDPKIRPSRPIMYYYKKPPENMISKNDVNDLGVYLAILNNYHNYIRTIREMTEIYNTEELIGDHKNIWKIFQKSKLD